MVTQHEGILREDVRFIVTHYRQYWSKNDIHSEIRDLTQQPTPGGPNTAVQTPIHQSPAQSENPIRQHYDMWNETLPKFISFLDEFPHSNTILSQHFDFIKSALIFGRLPKIHIPAALPYSSESVPIEDSDVIFADEYYAARILRCTIEGEELQNKVLVVRDSSDLSTRTSFTIKDVISKFKDLLKQGIDPGIDVADMSAKRGDPITIQVPVSTIIPCLEDEGPRITHKSPPRNFLNLASKPKIFAEPACLSGKRPTNMPFDGDDPWNGDFFSILSDLLSTLRLDNLGSFGKQTTSPASVNFPNDFEQCQNFQIIGQAFSSSLWHKDSSAIGTWIRCLFGVKLWPIVPLMTEKDRQTFFELGPLWVPSDHSVPLIVLHPGDTLIMLPGNDNVHAPITLEDCGMEGGLSGMYGV